MSMRVVLMEAEEVELNKIVGDFCLWQEVRKRLLSHTLILFVVVVEENFTSFR